MEASSISGLHDELKGIVREKNDRVEVIDEQRLRSSAVDELIHNAVFSPLPEVLKEARRLIKGCSYSLGAKASSIQCLYSAMGRGRVRGFTVPAINIRGLTYDTARAIFRSARRTNAGAFIFEIAKSEIDYTEQRPSEYSACVMAAAIKEGFRGPVFIQGDHFQINAKKYALDKDTEINNLKALIIEALAADFFNIDIDASTTVDMSRPLVADQQRPNYEITAALTVFMREHENKGITVSIGGEIGEVGGKNSTEDELRAFMDGYLGILGGRLEGISKISVQTGTSHGGVVLPDGSIAKVKVDFDTIEKLSKVSREVYGIAGVVQHGASTLPDDAMDLFLKKGTAEVHLATGFQNLVYESEAFPNGLKEKIYSHLRDRFSSERKEGETEEQFIYKTRKKGFGPFKKEIWCMPEENKRRLGEELEERFTFLFKKLNVVNTLDAVNKWIK